ncbi:Pyridine nucleotide-disulfide oxidoreductase, NAD-binding domain protein [Moelleriella libera RCEF 2490]|uniref:Pyridine nucleotide-disulfide oxidoreductase, NAD-binding domain protein n=1 Tax=Moelleriella libera RCEF 2490 TaxID=1081109 RepID=A0A168B7J4_9HYPO|nr:Pyridine nucleotide-disulfide oxidoreductase, NAD-binding domain protein [Moelleriella libera RCEF 2490]
MASSSDAVAAPTVRVFIAGGSYAGLSTAVNLLDLGKGLSPRMLQGKKYEHHANLPAVNWAITIVDERDGFFHLIGSPLALADAEYAKKAWVKYQDLPCLHTPQVRVIQGSVTSVNCEAKTATTVDAATKVATTHEYDYFVAATGLRRAWPVVPQSLTRKQYLIEAGDHIHAVVNAHHGVVVVGGGAVGIEMAAELKMVKPNVKVVLVHSRDKLLSAEALSDECKDKALELLRETGVDVLMNHRLAASQKVDTTDGSSKYELTFTNGHKMVASEVIMALSQSRTTSTYLPSSAIDEEGFVKIQPSAVFSPGTPNARFHLCAGDLTKWSGIKRCGWAMHSGHFVAQNIHKLVTQEQTGQETKLEEFDEVAPMIGLAVGKKAVASGPDGTVSGEETMQAYFRDDLGFTICWDWMGLGGRKKEELSAV